ncbi:MAG TPA: response regulator [Kiloniellales bacterium]|nr:response regulator [Kiloniellales bacterium]
MSKLRVLQVEDDPNSARIVERSLGAAGCACETTESGTHAVELATNRRYDLILLDVRLPDIDGYEVLRRVRSAGIDTPILIQSGLVDRAEWGKGVAFGQQDVLLKPFGRAELLERVKAMIRRSNQTRASDPAPEPAASGRDAAATDQAGARRNGVRVRTLKAAQIVFRNCNCVINCLLLNVSAGGAALQSSDPANVPDRFVLQLRNGPRFSCEVCWRHGNKIGVHFLKSRPLPGPAPEDDHAA